MGIRVAKDSKVRLTRTQRESLARILARSADDAVSALDDVERALNDHWFAVRVFHFPPSEVRRLISPRKGIGLRKRAQILEDALSRMPWQLSVDYKAFEFDLKKFRELIDGFISTSNSLLTYYADQQKPRRPPQSVRDNITIPEIADLFDRVTGHAPNPDQKDWEHLDRKCVFVIAALESADIPCPAAGDTSKGEEHQGRLRRILKAHDRRKQRAATRKRALASG